MTPTITRACAITRGVAVDNAVMAAINAQALEPLTADDVYVHEMRLASNAFVEQDWLCLTRSALEQGAALIAGRPVAVQHNQRALPIARFIDGAVRGFTPPRAAQFDGDPTALYARFYLLRGGAGDELHRAIRGGIYRDVSISWRCSDAECSICQQSILRCNHQLGEIYGEDATPQRSTPLRCWGLVRQLDAIVEGSLVFEGADSCAALTRDYAFGHAHGGVPPLGMAPVTHGQAYDDDNETARGLLRQARLLNLQTRLR